MSLQCCGSFGVGVSTLPQYSDAPRADAELKRPPKCCVPLGLKEKKADLGSRRKSEHRLTQYSRSGPIASLLLDFRYWHGRPPANRHPRSPSASSWLPNWYGAPASLHSLSWPGTRSSRLATSTASLQSSAGLPTTTMRVWALDRWCRRGTECDSEFCFPSRRESSGTDRSHRCSGCVKGDDCRMQIPFSSLNRRDQALLPS